MYKEESIKTTKNNDILEDEKYVDILKKAFNYAHIPDNYYCLDGYSEEAICLEFCSEKCLWIVYDGERGNRYNILSYNQVLLACDDLIFRISKDENQRQRITNFFNSMHSQYSYIRGEIKELTKRIIELEKEQNKENVYNNILQEELMMMISERKRLLGKLKVLDYNGPRK